MDAVAVGIAHFRIEEILSFSQFSDPFRISKIIAEIRNSQRQDKLLRRVKEKHGLSALSKKPEHPLRVNFRNRTSMIDLVNFIP